MRLLNTEMPVQKRFCKPEPLTNDLHVLLQNLFFFFPDSTYIANSSEFYKISVTVKL